MTYKELKDAVLQLLDRYSVDGEPVAMSYNGQADDVARIPALARDGLYYVTTAARSLPATAPLENPVIRDAMAVFDLPEDYYRMAGGLWRTDELGRTAPYRRFRMIGGRQLMVPKEDLGRFRLDYYRYPHIPDGWPEDESDELDCPEEAGWAVACYVAAHLAMEDSSFLYSTLYNEFERKLSRLTCAEVCAGETEDVYEL